MKKYVAFIILLINMSCRSYIDKNENIHNDYMDFNYNKNYNEFTYKSKVNAVADTETYYTTHFSVNLPKNIKSWKSSGNEFYFEYPNKEIIYINSGYKNNKDSESWTLRETKDSEIYNLLSSYWNEKKYNEDLLYVNKINRSSKIYSDGKVLILLYNVRQDDLNNHLELIKDFKYLN